MTLEERINEIVQKMYLAYEANSHDDAWFYSKQLEELISQRTPAQVKQMEIEKGLV
jgi:hypothetical protein